MLYSFSELPRNVLIVNIMTLTSTHLRLEPRPETSYDGAVGSAEEEKEKQAMSMASGSSGAALPLRLWSAAHVHSLSPGTKPFIVEVASGVCAVLTADGVAALVVEGEPSLPPAVATAPLPTLRRSSDGKASWCGRASALPALATTAALAELLVDSLRHYWSRQVREPSVRGFLSILSKQFSASHLYLFELLQNAVDEGATSVVVERTSHISLCVAHNGRRFAPLDVVGLSSVGLSTKAGRSAIGCMGIGFKAVFRRWSEVTVRDGRWGFRFEKHAKGRDSSLPDHAWVLLPQWVPPPARTPPRPEWCRFELAKVSFCLPLHCTRILLTV